MNTRKRYMYMDVLRILACLGVIYNHTKEYGFFMFATREPGSMQYFAEMFLSMQCKFAVPVFFALSGALMLGREISIGDLWRRRIPRIGFVLLLFSVVYYVLSTGTQANLKTFVFGVYEAEWGYVLWYLYAYLAYLVMLPMLSQLARTLNDWIYLYVFALAVLFRCLVPGIEAYYWEGIHKLNPNFNLSFFTCDIVLYPLLGYFLHHRVQIRHLRKALPALCIASILLTVVSCRMTYRDYWRTWTTYTQTYHELFAPVLCAAVYSGIRVFFEGLDENSRTGRMIRWISGCTFGIYLVHPLFVDRLEGLGGMFLWMRAEGVLPLLGSLMYSLIMLLLSLALVCLLRLIPGVRKLIS